MISDPEKKLNVIKRFLHVLALVQNNKDPQNWNCTTLANTISIDEFEKPLSDKNIRDYIQNHLKDDLGLDVDVKKGERRIELAEPLEGEMLERIAQVYASFIIKDSSRDAVLKNFIKKHPLDCLWIMARIYFASLEKRKIRFDYWYKVDKKHENIVHPYHLVFRNNNLYLVCRLGSNDKVYPLIVNRIVNVKVLDEYFEEDLPDVDSIFQDTLGSFIGKKYDVTIRFTKTVFGQIDQVLSILEPEVKEIDGGEAFEARFTVSDNTYLCKQLFLYGSDVEIIEPLDLRERMVKMLEDSLSIYQ